MKIYLIFLISILVWFLLFWVVLQSNEIDSLRVEIKTLKSENEQISAEQEFLGLCSEIFDFKEIPK
jgi:cell division protein FtsB